MIRQLFAKVSASLRSFFELEAAAGIVLAIAALFAILVSNTSFAPIYQALTHLSGEINLGDGVVVLKKPLYLWVNDLWMAIFFFLVGLELKESC